MVTTLQRDYEIGQYPRPEPVQVVARAGGWTEATARQVLNPADPRCPFTRAALIVHCLNRAGLGLTAERLCLSIDLARTPSALRVSRQDVDAASLAEQEADGAEDVAQLALQTAAEWDTYRRRAVKHIAAAQHFLNIGDAYFGRGA